MNFDKNAVFDRTCVRFSMTSPDGERSAAISAKALVEFFGAEMNEDSLLKSYRVNAKMIHTVAERMGAETLDKGILVTDSALEAAKNKHLVNPA